MSKSRFLGKSVLTRALNKAPIDLSGRRFHTPTIGIAPDTSMTAQLHSMTAEATLFAIVERISTAVGAVEWHLYRKAPSGLKKDRQEVTNHGALTVWENPNGFYTQREFVEASVQHYDLAGEMPWLIGRAPGAPRGMPIELWPVRPDRIEPVPHPVNFLDGYLYKGTEIVPLTLNDVIVTKRQNPTNPYRGLSPVASLMYDLHADQAASAYNAIFFRNGAMPGGVIETEEELSDPDFKKLVMRWREQHQGVENAHRVAILERAKFHELSYSRKDMEFVDLRRFTKDQVRQAFGFPKPLLGDVEDVNRANADAGEVTFARWVLNPRLDAIKDTLNTRFLPLFGEFGKGYEFDYEDPTPPDQEGERAERDSKVGAVVQLVSAGFDPSASLRAFDLPDIPFRGKEAPGES